MSLLKTQSFIINATVYPFDILFVINMGNDRVEDLLTNLQWDYDNKSVQDIAESRKGRTIMLKGGQTIVRLYDYKNDPEHYGYVAHEIFHVVEFILNRVGMKLCRKSDEAYAYLIQFITSMFFENIWEKTRPQVKTKGHRIKH